MLAENQSLNGTETNVEPTRKRNRKNKVLTFQAFRDRLNKKFYKSKRSARLGVFRSKSWSAADKKTAISMIDDHFKNAAHVSKNKRKDSPTLETFTKRLETDPWSERGQARTYVSKIRTWSPALKKKAMVLVDAHYAASKKAPKTKRPSVKKTRVETRVPELTRHVAHTLVGDEETLKVARFLMSSVLKQTTAPERERITALLTMKTRFAMQDEHFLQILRA